MVGSTVNWANGTKICEGSDAMTSCIRDVPGTIGYIDSGHGHAEGLIEIELRNANGKFLSSLEALMNGGVTAAIDTAVFPSSADEDFGNVEVLNQEGEFTWPIVAVSYVYVRKDLAHFKTDDDRALFMAFLSALYDPNFIDACQEFGFSPVANAVRELGLGGIAMLEVSTNAPVFVFEVDTVVGEGQGDYVISSKRRSYGELEQTSTASDVASLISVNQMLEDKILTLEAKVQSLEKKLQAASPSNADETSVATDDTPALESSTMFFTSSDQSQLTAAVVMSSISIVLWAGAAIAFTCTKLMK
jgi:hypothetical protein